MTDVDVKVTGRDDGLVTVELAVTSPLLRAVVHGEGRNLREAQIDAHVTLSLITDRLPLHLPTGDR